MDRLVLGEIIGLFLGGVTLFTTLFFTGGELLRYVQFLQTGEGWGLVLQLILNTLPMVLGLTVGMGLLLACLLGFGRLSDDAELTAITAAGVSFPRVMAPVVAFGLLITSILAVGVHTIIPQTMHTRQALLDAARKELSSGSDAFFLPMKTGETSLLLIAMGGVRNDGAGVATLEDVQITQTKAAKARPERGVK